VVVGASSGIGEALARELGALGVDVALVSRRPHELQRVADDIEQMRSGVRVPIFVHDVRDTASAPVLFQAIATELGGLDLVIYSAGIMPRVGPAEYPTERDMAVIGTNLAGAVAWLNAAAERFAVQRGGTIVGISSMAGERGRRGSPVYCATKAALNSYLESLRARLASQGVRVVTVKPGFVRTQMLGGGPSLLPSISTRQAAQEILNASADGKREVFVPGWWRGLAMIVRSVPAPVFERLPIP
jgi:short-subunit dehydrogenase